VTELLRAVLNTLLREDFAGMRTRGSIVDGVLRFGRTEIPVRPDGFLCDVAVAEPVVIHDGRRYGDLTSVLALLRRWVDPVDLAGFDEFTRECHAALACTRPANPLDYDALAACAGHPVYPTANARVGMSAADQVRYAPEHQPTFALHWTDVPAARVTGEGVLPDWWPTAAEPDQVSFPVHPLTARGRRGQLVVRPTLSMRTVAVDPLTHLKLPLPISTLGLRNRRTIKPGTLIDGAIVQRLLAAILRREPALAGRVLLADEQTYRQTDDELLAFLLRRYPAELTTTEVVPLAALTARRAAERMVLDDLADRYAGGDRLAFLAAYLAPLLDFQTTLLLRYGVALESHQQNVSLVLDGDVRLLVKDNDGPRLRADRLRDALAVPQDADPALLCDRRILVTDTEPLIDLFTTITLHLCGGAVVFALPEPDRRRGLALIRELLAAAIDRHPPTQDAALLRARTLDAEFLPVKAMVTAGTLLTKRRSGASDINKFYLRDGPNYLSNRSI
jgi:siderophore synthetase component